MNSSEGKILKFIDNQNLITPGDKLLIGLSGGPDSVFALHFFLKYKSRLKINLTALHVNHQLRRKESDKDEEFCKSLCSEKNVEFKSTRVNVKKTAEQNNFSIEQAARFLRYFEFDKFAGKTECNKIVTAHNMNDNTETVLLNIIKGAGISGSSGIPVKRDNIIRPLMSVTKEEILEYLELNKLEYRNDLTNLSDEYQRNFLRNNVITALKENINPSLHKSIFNSSQNLKYANAFIKDCVDKLFTKYIETYETSANLTITGLGRENEFLVGELLKKLCHDFLQIDFERELLEQILGLIKGQVGKKINLVDNWIAYRDREQIVFRKKVKAHGTNEYELKLNSSLELKGITVGCELIDRINVAENKSGVEEIISADNLDDIFILRKWKSGDKFIPLGMKGTKKLSDFLNEQKVPAHKKNDYWVLTNNNEIVWVVGFRINDKYKLNDKTERACKLWMK